jgi:hypothetical protein
MVTTLAPSRSCGGYCTGVFCRCILAPACSRLVLWKRDGIFVFSGVGWRRRGWGCDGCGCSGMFPRRCSIYGFDSDACVRWILRYFNAAIKPLMVLGVRWTYVRPLRWHPAGAGDRQRRVAWWLGMRTYKGLFLIFLFVRILFAISSRQVAFGLFLACGCVCGFCTRLWSWRRTPFLKKRENYGEAMHCGMNWKEDFSTRTIVWKHISKYQKR